MRWSKSEKEKKHYEYRLFLYKIQYIFWLKRNLTNMIFCFVTGYRFHFRFAQIFNYSFEEYIHKIVSRCIGLGLGMEGVALTWTGGPWNF